MGTASLTQYPATRHSRLGSCPAAAVLMASPSAVGVGMVAGGVVMAVAGAHATWPMGVDPQHQEKDSVEDEPDGGHDEHHCTLRGGVGYVVGVGWVVGRGGWVGLIG